jgi:hypothetical protein
MSEEISTDRRRFLGNVVMTHRCCPARHRRMCEGAVYWSGSIAHRRSNSVSRRRDRMA